MVIMNQNIRRHLVHCAHNGTATDKAGLSKMQRAKVREKELEFGSGVW
jgi:hypothetical protein